MCIRFSFIKSGVTYTMEEGREMVKTCSSPLRTRTNDVDSLVSLLNLKSLSCA
jgi:hypothetical protein